MAEDTDDKVVEEDLEADVEEEEAKSEEREEDVVPVRKSVINAQRRIIESQRKKLDKASEKASDDDVELTPKAREAIRKELNPIVEGLKSQADDIEVREYLASHPEDRKIEKSIRRRMEAWGNVPVSEIAKTLKFEDAAEERKERRREASEKAAGSRLAGSSNRAEEVKLPDATQHAEIYKRMRRGEQLNLETGQWEPAKNR